jgi:hypothetical protein
VAAAMPIFDVTPLLTWTPAAASSCLTTQGTPCTYVEQGEPVTCVSATGFNVAADKNLATANAGCTP